MLIQSPTAQLARDASPYSGMLSQVAVVTIVPSLLKPEHSISSTPVRSFRPLFQPSKSPCTCPILYAMFCVVHFAIGRKYLLTVSGKDVPLRCGSDGVWTARGERGNNNHIGLALRPPIHARYEQGHLEIGHDDHDSAIAQNGCCGHSKGDWLFQVVEREREVIGGCRRGMLTLRWSRTTYMTKPSS